MSKKLDLNLRFIGQEVELFRTFMENLNLDEEGNPSEYPLGVEIGYEEECQDIHTQAAGVAFDLCFEEPRDAYYFALRLQQALEAWATFKQPAEAPYPRFLYSARMGYFCRQNAPGQFCLVGKTHLQVRREAPQDLFDAGDWQASDEELFLAAFTQQRAALLDCARQYVTTYQRRGAPGNEWFYANPIYATTTAMPMHLRLNASDNEHGRSWQLMWAHDTRRLDSRRVASTEQEFEQQLAAMLADAAAVATGQKGGQADG